MKDDEEKKTSILVYLLKEVYAFFMLKNHLFLLLNFSFVINCTLPYVGCIFQLKQI